MNALVMVVRGVGELFGYVICFGFVVWCFRCVGVVCCACNLLLFL